MAAAMNVSGASTINATKEEAYDDLRAMKMAATTKVQEVVRLYEELKGASDEGLDNLEAASRIDDYNEARGEVIADLQVWYVKTGEVIREKPGTKPTLKVKAAHSFMKRVKSYLKKTTTLGEEQEGKGEREWLEETREEFPEEIISNEDKELWIKDPVKGYDGGIKERLRGAAATMMNTMSPKRSSEKIRTSTPEDPGKRKRAVEGKIEKKGEGQKGKSGGKDGEEKEKGEKGAKGKTEGCVEPKGDKKETGSGHPTETPPIGMKDEKEEIEATDDVAEERATIFINDEVDDILEEVGDEAMKERWEELKRKEEKMKEEEEAEETKRNREREEETKEKKRRFEEILERREKELKEKERLEEERKKAAKRRNEEKREERRKNEKREREEEAERSKEKAKEKKANERAKASWTTKKSKLSVGKARGDESSDEEEEEGKGEWQCVKRGKKGRRGTKHEPPSSSSPSSSSSSSSDESSSTGSESSSEEGRRKRRKRGSRIERNIRVESLARERLKDAAPKRDEDRYGDNGTVDYHATKNKFQSLSKVSGINFFDVLSEMPKWFRGPPKMLVEAFQGSGSPKKAVKAAWRELDSYYAVHIQTAAERIKPITAKAKIAKDDVTALMELMADLRAVLNESRFAGVDGELDQQVIIRDVVMSRVPHMADRFYEKEAKRMKKDKKFKFKFQDLISEIADRAQVLKLQGKNNLKPQTAKVAATTSAAHGSFRDVLKDSPPKQQGPLPNRTTTSQSRCRFCQQGHQTDSCNKLLSMSLRQRLESLKKGGHCYRCLAKGHLERDCTQVQPPICKICKMGHQSMLHNPAGKAPVKPAQIASTTGGTTENTQGAGSQEDSTTA